MASYRIQWKQTAQKELRNLRKTSIAKILQAVEMLAVNPYPSGSRKLRGAQHTFRIRVATYRVVYTVASANLVIEIIRVGHRKEIYRRFLI